MAWNSDKRRARTGTHPMAQQRLHQQAMTRDGGVCWVCGRPGADQVDHKLALCEGGPNTLDNLAPIHSTPCHRDKTRAETTRAHHRGPRPTASAKRPAEPHPGMLR